MRTMEWETKDEEDYCMRDESTQLIEREKMKREINLAPINGRLKVTNILRKISNRKFKLSIKISLKTTNSDYFNA